MGKEKPALKPDIIVKNYWRNKEQFADFFNAVLFDGKQVIKPKELEDLDTEESSVLEHKEYAESIGASRDTVKIRKKSTVYGVEFVILGMEGQEHIHYAMPMRVMGYDYAAYQKQYVDNAAKYKTAKSLTEEEYLSKMKKDDRLIPVITVVVYYGEKPWDGAVSLHGMLHISEEMKPFVNDYRMHLVEARKNDLKLHNMCTVFEETRREGIAEGEAKGIIETGYEFGISEEVILARLQKKLNISLAEAQEYVKKFGRKNEEK